MVHDRAPRLAPRLAVAAVTLVLAVAGGLLLATPSDAEAGGMMMPKTGDANSDGVMDSLDALQLMFYDAGLVPTPPYSDMLHASSDVNCDFKLNSLDAALILQAVAGLYDLRP